MHSAQSYSIIAVTPTPFGGGQSAQLAYTGNSVSRAVRLGLEPPGDDYGLPDGSSYDITSQSWFLPSNLSAVGAYSAFVTTTSGQESSTVFILASSSELTVLFFILNNVFVMK